MKRLSLTNIFSFLKIRGTRTSHSAMLYDRAPLDTIKISYNIPSHVVASKVYFDNRGLPLLRDNIKHLRIGNFLRVHFEDNKELLQLVSYLGESIDTDLIYHGVLSNVELTNSILCENEIIDSDPILTLQSFLKTDVKILKFIDKYYDEIIEDESIFLNRDLIFSYYGQGIDINFLTINSKIVFLEKLAVNGYDIIEYPGSERLSYKVYSK